MYNEESSNPNLETNSNPAEEKILKGDAIGNTMYSERFVLKTLLKLKDTKWNDELESDMCTIWDMATEKDVIEYLLDNNFIELSIEILLESKEQRLREILIGIVGNMCVYPEYTSRIITNANFDVILKEIISSDSLVLIQTMRVYKALFHCNNIEHDILISENQLELMNYILQSSTNNELLLYSLQVTSDMIDKIKCNCFKYNFLNNINEAFKEICNYYFDNADSQDFHKSISAYCKNLDNLCSILNDITDKLIYKKIIDDNNEAIKSTKELLQIILNIINNLDFIQNNAELFEYYIYCLANFLVTFNTTFDEKIVLTFCNIFDLILENNIEFQGAVYESITNYLIYSLSNIDTNVVKHLFKNWPKDKIKILFYDNIINKIECNDKFVQVIENICI